MANQHTMPLHHPRVIGARHMVASANYLAAHVGFEILEAGGNAMDAGVAPIMIHLAGTRETVSISGLVPCPEKDNTTGLLEGGADVRRPGGGRGW